MNPFTDGRNESKNTIIDSHWPNTVRSDGHAIKQHYANSTMPLSSVPSEVFHEVHSNIPSVAYMDSFQHAGMYSFDVSSMNTSDTRRDALITTRKDGAPLPPYAWKLARTPSVVAGTGESISSDVPVVSNANPTSSLLSLPDEPIWKATDWQSNDETNAVCEVTVFDDSDRADALLRTIGFFFFLCIFSLVSLSEYRTSGLDDAITPMSICVILVIAFVTNVFKVVFKKKTKRKKFRSPRGFVLLPVKQLMDELHTDRLMTESDKVITKRESYHDADGELEHRDVNYNYRYDVACICWRPEDKDRKWKLYWSPIPLTSDGNQAERAVDDLTFPVWFLTKGNKWRIVWDERYHQAVEQITDSGYYAGSSRAVVSIGPNGSALWIQDGLLSYGMSYSGESYDGVIRKNNMAILD